MQRLSKGWYDNMDQFILGHPLRKNSVDHCKLWATCLGIAGTKFVSLCDGIPGGIRLLVVDIKYVDDSINLPIDTLVFI